MVQPTEAALLQDTGGYNLQPEGIQCTPHMLSESAVRGGGCYRFHALVYTSKILARGCGVYVQDTCARMRCVLPLPRARVVCGAPCTHEVSHPTSVSPRLTSFGRDGGGGCSSKSLRFTMKVWGSASGSAACRGICFWAQVHTLEQQRCT